MLSIFAKGRDEEMIGPLIAACSSISVSSSLILKDADLFTYYPDTLKTVKPYL